MYHSAVNDSRHCALPFAADPQRYALQSHHKQVMTFFTFLPRALKDVLPGFVNPKPVAVAGTNKSA
jgi:hypothetical protein